MPVLDPVLRKDREMERTDVWFGSMTHGNFSVGRDDLEQMVVIHSIDERSFMLADDADDYMFEKEDAMEKYSKDPMSAPLKIKTTPDFGIYTFGPFMNIEESKMFAESIELDEINGPRMVTIQDRKNGEVFSKFLSCKLQPVWDEHIEEHVDNMEDEDDEDEEQEDINMEYTYGDEDEGSDDVVYDEEEEE